MKTSKGTSGSRKRSRPPLRGIEAALQSIARAARSLDAKWYLFGAQAVALHGVPRTTQDVDVTLLADRPTAEIVAAFRKAGVRPEYDDPAFIARTRVIPGTHVASGWKVDVVLGAVGLETHIAEQAIAKRVGRVLVPLIRAEHLVVLKVLAGRPQDLVDVGNIVRLKGKRLDLDEAEQLLRALETELGESGLVTRLDDARRLFSVR